jgi:hypothetical protein
VKPERASKGWEQADEKNIDGDTDGFGVRPVQHAGPASGSDQRRGDRIGSQIDLANSERAMALASPPSPLRLGPLAPFAHPLSVLVVK